MRPFAYCEVGYPNSFDPAGTAPVATAPGTDNLSPYLRAGHGHASRCAATGCRPAVRRVVLQSIY
jgi:hypothetical protein